MISQEGIIWEWSLTYPKRVLYIFRSVYEDELEIDLWMYQVKYPIKILELYEPEKRFINSLIKTNLKTHE